MGVRLALGVRRLASLLTTHHSPLTVTGHRSLVTSTRHSPLTVTGHWSPHQRHAANHPVCYASTPPPKAGKVEGPLPLVRRNERAQVLSPPARGGVPASAGGVAGPVTDHRSLVTAALTALLTTHYSLTSDHRGSRCATHYSPLPAPRTGSPFALHLSIPPARLATRVKPARRRSTVACAERAPERHT